MPRKHEARRACYETTPLGMVPVPVQNQGIVSACGPCQPPFHTDCPNVYNINPHPRNKPPPPPAVSCSLDWPQFYSSGAQAKTFCCPWLICERIGFGVFEIFFWCLKARGAKKKTKPHSNSQNIGLNTRNPNHPPRGGVRPVNTFPAPNPPFICSLVGLSAHGNGFLAGPHPTPPGAQPSCIIFQQLLATCKPPRQVWQ